MNLLDCLGEEVPGVREAVASSPWVADAKRLWTLVRGFVDAHSPTANVLLPGTIIDTLTAAVQEMDLAADFYRDFNGTGNAAILLGKRKDHVDLLVDAHLDKPTFGVSEVARVDSGTRATLFACCANRFPPGLYRIAAKVLRFDEAREAVTICGKGTIVSQREKNRDRLFFELADGEIECTDLVAMDVPAHRDGSRIFGSGIDDGGGMAVTLATASVLKVLEPLLEEASVNCLFTFSDNEEWPPDSFFSIGASKTTFSLRAPTFGSIVVDVHTVGAGYPIAFGRGISCGFISSQGKGAAVPLNYQRLTTQLIDELNAHESNIAQHNKGYFSRSDDFALM